MKRLLIMRHATAGPGSPDRDRGLTDAGLLEAGTLGRRLAGDGVGVDAIVSSTAVRAMQTAVAVRDNLFPEHACEADIHTSAVLYNASAAQWLETIAALDAGWDDVLMVGHNPAVAHLAVSLSERPLPVPPGTILDIRLPAWDRFTDATLADVRLAA